MQQHCPTRVESLRAWNLFHNKYVAFYICRACTVSVFRRNVLFVPDIWDDYYRLVLSVLGMMCQSKDLRRNTLTNT